MNLFIKKKKKVGKKCNKKRQKVVFFSKNKNYNLMLNEKCAKTIWEEKHSYYWGEWTQIN